MKSSILFSLGALIFLTACDVTYPSQVETGSLRVSERQVTQALHASSVDATAVDRIAEDYKRNGRGPISVLVSYPDQTSPAQARQQAMAYKKAFAAYGVTVATNTASVPKGAPLHAIVSYQGMKALPPQGCTRMSGYQGAEGLYEIRDYGMGCEVKTAISRMIATPDDLLGKESAPSVEARRAGTTTEKYISGTPNPKIDGIRSSDVGG